MRVQVLVAGVYNGPDHHDPVKAQPGDVIEVAGGWYAAELVDKGFVTAHVAEPGQPAEVGPGENQATAGPVEQKPAEPKGRKLAEIRRLKDLKG